MDFSAVLATQTSKNVEPSPKSSIKTKTSSDSSYESVMKQSMQSNEKRVTTKDDKQIAEKTRTAVSEFVSDLKDVLKGVQALSAQAGQKPAEEQNVSLEAGFGLEIGAELEALLLRLGLVQGKEISAEELQALQTSQAWIEGINEVVLELMAALQSLSAVLTTTPQSNGNEVDVRLSLDLDQSTVNQLLGKMSKEQFNDLSKVLSQLQNMLAQQSDLSKLDAKVVALLNQFNVFKEQNPTLQSGQSQLNPQQVAKDNIISFIQMAQSNQGGENKSNTNSHTNSNTNSNIYSPTMSNANASTTEGEQTKPQPFLLRTDMTKVMWQSEMSKAQQMALNVEMKGNQVNTEAFMKGLDKMLSSSALMKNGAMSKLVIKLNPESLGTIRIELIQSQNSLIAKLHVQNEQVRSLIESQLSGLKQSFAAQNVQVDRFEISSNIDFDKYQKQFQQGNFNQSSGEQKDSAEQSEENQAAEELNFKSKLEEIQQTLEEESI